MASDETNFLCPMCECSHPLRNCVRFLSSTILQRMIFVIDKGLCSCKRCEKMHNTLLHRWPCTSIFVKMSATFVIYPPGAATFRLRGRALIDMSYSKSVMDESAAKELAVVVHGLEGHQRCYAKVSPHWERRPTDELEFLI